MTQANDEPTRRRRRFRTRSKLLLACLTGLLAFGVAEVGLRLAGFSYPLPYFPDEFCGARLQPGFRGWWSKEGAASIEVNSAGFRDREHALKKPAGTIRVAVLGDSYIEAFQVPQNAMFGSVLERKLNANAAAAGINQSFEVLSFGVSGYSTTQELLALRHHVWQFDPDIVLLAFLPANDVRGNSRELEPDDCRPFFDLIDDELVPDFRFRDDPVYQYALTNRCRFKTAVINASRVAQLLYAVQSRPATGEMSEEDSTRDDSTEVGLDDECFRPPQTDEWESAWQLTERLIEQMQREVTQRDSNFAVAVLTSSLQVDPDSAVRRAYAERLGVEDLSYADRRITELGERTGFETIILSEPLRNYAERTGRFVHGFSNTSPGRGHWNRDGHREAARVCAGPLLQLVIGRSQSTLKDADSETGDADNRNRTSGKVHDD
ncbi:SGNH/GDSL hydrolase family protein [bacterium]|nr:SGNH/GDSL hydrolase family protein [bacterium]